MSAEFRIGDSIPVLMQRYNLSRKKVTKILQQILKDDYSECAKHIISLSGAKSAIKNRGRKNPHTEEWNEKISKANQGRKLSATTKEKIGLASRTRFERGTWSKEQHTEAMQKAVRTKRNNGYFELHSKRHSEWMKLNAPMRGKTTSDETKAKQSLAKKKFYVNGGISNRKGEKHSSETRKKLSENTKLMWANSQFQYGGTFCRRSKLEISVYEKFVAAFPSAMHSYVINNDGRTFIYDIFIPELNMLIEVNGDYWHLNPKLYASDYIDQSRNVTAQGVWDADATKREVAVSKGYAYRVLWESNIKQPKDV